jgi:hypothetical protein
MRKKLKGKMPHNETVVPDRAAVQTGIPAWNPFVIGSRKELTEAKSSSFSS